MTRASTVALPPPHRRDSDPKGRAGHRTGTVPERPTPPLWRRKGAQDRLWAFAMICPMGLGMLIFHVWPALRTFYFSFTEWGPFGGAEWVGWENYRELIADPAVFGALRNSIVYTLIVLISVPLATILATLINQRIRGASVYRVLYFLPVVTMPAAVALVWRLMFNGDFGPINTVLRLIGIPGTYWLSNPRTALLAIGLVGIWLTIGHHIIILLAGLRGIPTTYYEAAELDGASWLARFRHVTLPLLTPSIFFVTVISILGSMQMFDLMFMMIGADARALDSVRTVVYLFYEQGFVHNDKGYAAAISVVLFLVIMAFTIVQLRLQRRWVHYG